MPYWMLAAANVTEKAVIADLLVILASAAIVAIVMQRIRLAVIPAYLITGALIGPHALRLVSSPEGLGVISHLAIILLLFGIGLELHLSMLRPGLSRLLAAGLGSCLLCVLVGWPVAMQFGLAPPAAMAIAMGLSLSSTAVVLRILTDRRELQRNRGRLALAILVIQDLVVLGMLASLPVLAKWSGATAVPTDMIAEARPHGGWWYLGVACIRVVSVAALVVLGKMLLPRLMSESLRGRSLEVMLAMGVAAALGAAVVTQAIGFSLEMGALLAGFVLAGTPFRHQLSGQTGPLRDLFIAVFFATLGMRLNLETVASWWLVIVAGVLVLTLVKAVLISGACWVSGASAGIAIAVGLALAQAGEFSLILLGAANDKGIINNEVLAIAVAIVVLSLILTPAMVSLGDRLGRVFAGFGTAPWIPSSLALGRRHGGDDPQEDEPRHVIIAGYGPIGRRIAAELRELGVPLTVVELNPATVREQAHNGIATILGDVGSPHVLDAAGIAEAAALVLTVPDEEASLRACSLARRLAPDVFIATRTRVVSKQAGLVETGADHVTVDETAAAQAMLDAIVERLGVGRPAATSNDVQAIDPFS